MSITRADVADLQPGDVVEMSFPDGAVLRGPLVSKYEGWLYLGPILIRSSSIWPTGTGNIPDGAGLTVISRAPRPLYVNHPRTEAVPGDVVRDADSDSSVITYNRCKDAGGTNAWRTTAGVEWLTGRRKNDLPIRLRLLVDGETGQVVP